MSSHLGTLKRLVSTFTNKLDHIVSSLKSEKLEEAVLEAQAPQEEKQELVSRLEEGISAITTVSSKVEKTLTEYATTLDNMENKGAKESEDYESYAAKAEAALVSALDLSVLLEARLRALNGSTSGGTTINNITAASQAQTKPLELPPIPTPTFGGSLWEWDNFWELFQSNIHTRELPEMVKYNYLLRALRGEARESIKKFQVTKENYSKAVDFLLNKYNNKELLVNHLVEKLDSCGRRSNSVRDLRSLLEQVQVIVTQLKEKGEEVNSSWLIKKVLAKFLDFVKRKVITRKQRQQPDDALNMETLFTYVDEILRTEEMVSLLADENSTTHRKSWTAQKPHAGRAVTRSCMYCREDHASERCKKFPTPQERASYLRERRLCLICASNKHATASCKGRPCFICKESHHISCCFKRVSNNWSPAQRQGIDPPSARTPKTKEDVGPKGEKAPSKEAPRTFKSAPTKVLAHAIISTEENTEQKVEAQPQSVLSSQVSDRPSLPTGEVTILDPDTKSLTKVDVLLDTGAEISFVDSALAEKLKLPVLEEKHIRLRTFGSKEANEKKYKVVNIDVWDKDGALHSLELLTSEVLTTAFLSPKIPNEDLDYVRSLDLSIPINKSKEVIKPKILLGCDQLWSFIRSDVPSITLPSGLHLLPTKLGHLISGKAKNTEVQAQQVSQCKQEEWLQWEKCWSMNTIQVNTASATDSEVTAEDQEQWEKFWTLDAAGTDEFMGTEKEAREALDREVWLKFRESIQKREDGYYVRLPWKHQYPTLPDNRAIA